MNNVLNLQILDTNSVLSPCVSAVSCESHQSCESSLSSIKPTAE